MKWKAACLLAVVAVVLGVYWLRAREPDPRETIVFWGSAYFKDDIYNVVHAFERKFPQYKVILSTAAARNLTDDAQRLMSAIAGGVPPDLVWFDRFAIGEWAARGAMLDLRPLLDSQSPDDPYRIDIADYYDWAVAEASYAPPTSDQTPGIFGIPSNADVRALFVNSDVLRQGGLVDEQGNPLPPENWDELLAYTKRLTLYRTPGDPRSGIIRLGFAPHIGNSWLYLYAFQAGGEMMNPQRTRVTMDSPPVVRALKFMMSLYDAVGGVGQVNAFNDVSATADRDPFLRGALAMKIDGDDFLRTIADWRPRMDFMVLPPPMPADQLALGRKPVTWSGGWAYTIPATATNRQGAFRLIQFLSSEEGIRLIERGRRERSHSEGRIYLPMSWANRTLYEKLVREFVLSDASIPDGFKRAYEVFAELRLNTRTRPVTPIGQLLWNQHVRATDAALNHGYAEEARRSGRDEAEIALSRMQVDAQAALQRVLAPPPPVRVDWKPYFGAYAGIVMLPFAAMYIAYRRGRRIRGYRAREVGSALMFLLPWILGMVVLVAGPILFSIVFSFTRYDVLNPARYVGLDNYAQVLRDPVFYKSLSNTAFMILGIPIGMAVSLAIAMLLNHAIRGIGLYRAAFYLPVVMPLVATSLLWAWLLNPSFGAINSVLAWIYETAPMQWIERGISLFTSEPFQFTLPPWLQDPDWSKPSIILMGLWKAGGGMIIWLAGLQSIPNELYEAASIDGAGRWKRFVHVTLPMLSPFILFNLVIGMIGTMQIFGEAYIMTAGGPFDSTLFYAYYLFKQAFQFFRMGYASALAWILFVIVLVLTLVQLWLSRRWVHYERS